VLRSAIVGCGNIGKGHAPAYKGCREIQLAAVVDILRDRAASLGKEHGVPAYTKLKDVLKRPDIDFIDVCVPSGLHGDIAIAAAKAGKHCIVEKPLDVTPQRCDEIIAAFQGSGTVLGGIYQHRYHDDTRKLKAALDAGRLGKLTLLTCSTPWWRTQEYYESGDWRGTWNLDGGGALMNQSIHAIDLLVWFGGPVKRVTAYCALLAHERIEVEDVAVAACEFQSGALGVIEGTTAAYPGSGVLHKVMGTGGMVYLTADKITHWRLRDEEGATAEKPQANVPAETVSKGAAADPTVLSDNLFSRNLDDIARAARTGGQPCVTGAEARKGVEVICAIYESARTGKEVRLPLREFHA
jgi:predicted dehydrogenase